MTKALLTLVIVCLPLIAFGQQTEEKKYYIYNIISFSGNMRQEGLKVDVDDGKSIEKLKDSNGEKMKFRTPAAALMYLQSQGWELFYNGSTSEGSMINGLGVSISSYYWIIRKPCTKKEFEKAVIDGIKK